MITILLSLVPPQSGPELLFQKMSFPSFPEVSLCGPCEMTSCGRHPGHAEKPHPPKEKALPTGPLGGTIFIFYCTVLTFLNYNDSISQMSPKNILNQLINKSIALQDGIYQIHN